MKISREQVAANRARILTAAGRLFRAHGIDNVSIAQIMGAAGLTHGGFYNHFSSKDALVVAVLRGQRASAEPLSADQAQAFAARYLSNQHRNDLAGGCDFAGLGSEAVRLPEVTRSAMTKRLNAQIDRLTPSAEGGDRQVAIANWATMVGAMLLSRISDDPALSEEILASARAGVRLQA